MKALTLCIIGEQVHNHECAVGTEGRYVGFITGANKPLRPAKKAIVGYTRKEMVNNKEKLLEMGGVMEGLVYKWNEKK